MYHKIIFLALIVCTYTLSMAAGGTLAGDGTEISPYLIEDYEDLKMVGDNLSAWYRLANTIDASPSYTGESSPIGSNVNQFVGNFNGAGYQIHSLVIEQSAEDFMGLFASVGTAGVIDSLGVLGIIRGDYYVGGIAAINSGLISNSYFIGTVVGGIAVGGVAGMSDGTVTKSYSRGIVQGRKNIGGIVGDLRGVVTHSFSSAEIPNAFSWYMGGLVGKNNGSIEFCYSNGPVSNGTYSGGLVGYRVGGRTTNSYWDIQTSGHTKSTTAGSGTYKGLTTDEMKKEESYSGWNFEDLWEIVEDVQYPIIRNQKNIPLGRADTTLLTIDTTDMSLFLLNDYSANGTVATESKFAFHKGKGDLIEYWYVPGILISEGDTLWGNETYVLGPQIEITINTYSELKNIGTTAGYPIWASYRLTDNIDASGSASETGGFNPIGSTNNPFQGRFNGSGYGIYGLTIDKPSEDYIGLFASITKHARLDSVVLSVKIIGNDIVGGLVGYSEGTISNSRVSGSTQGNNIVGGLVGEQRMGEISKSSSSVKVTSANQFSGGLIGVLYGSVHKCFSTGIIQGNRDVGGLVGSSSGSIEFSYSTAHSQGQHNVGGLVGYTDGGRLYEVYAAGRVNAMGSYEGGITGYSNRLSIFKGTWDLENTGVSKTAQHINFYNKGISTVKMKQQSSFVDWDFVEAWDIIEGITYPTLQGVNDAPFGEVDQSALGIDTLNMSEVLANDIDAEGTSPTVWNYVFQDTVGGYIRSYYAPGEVVFLGDTLWGAMSYSETPQEVILINDYTTLKEIGINPAYPLTGAYRLTKNIDASGSATENGVLGFTPIGTQNNLFRGSFNGAGFTIHDLFINREQNYTGLFAFLDADAVIDSLHVTGNIHGHDHVGGIAGASKGSITQSSFIGSVTGHGAIGGLIGDVRHGVISRSSSQGHVESSGYYSGGLIGINAGQVRLSFSTSSVVGSTYAGGLTAINYGYVERSFASGSVRVRSYYGGGFVGESKGDIDNCYSIGHVSGDSHIGGFAGIVFGEVRNSYAIGFVTADNEGAGFVATTWDTYYHGTIINSYWNAGLTGQLTSDRTRDLNYYSLTIPEMQHVGSFVGWNYSSIWHIQEGTSFPGLQGMNNPPIAFTDTATVVDSTDMSPYVLNDVDADGITVLVGKYNSIDSVGGYLTFNYTVGEVVSIGDTLWGGSSEVVSPQPAQSISSYDDLKLIGSDPSYPLTGSYILTQNINASASASDDGGAGFIPIAMAANEEFTGKLDGAGFTISDLTINRSGDDKVGLLSVIGSGGVVVDLSVTGSVSGRLYTGGIAGVSSGEIKKCHFSGAVNGLVNVGGVVGSQYSGSIDSSTSSVTVRAAKEYAGGFAGSVYGLITHSNSSGVVYASGEESGGFAGAVYGTIDESTSHTDIQSDEYNIGGFAGTVSGDITRSSSFGDVENEGEYTGGFVGELTGSITLSYSAGSVFNDYNYTGGFVGRNSGSIDRSFSTSSVVSDDSYSGGFVGSHVGTISNSYSAGTVQGYDNVGGFVGHQDGSIENCYSVSPVLGNTGGGFSGSGITDVINSYWNAMYSKQSGSNYNTEPWEAELSVSEFKKTISFIGWNFTDTWDIIEGQTFPGIKGISNIMIGTNDTLTVPLDTNDLSPLLVNDRNAQGLVATVGRFLESQTVGGSIKYTYLPGYEVASGDTLWGTVTSAVVPLPEITISDYTELTLIGTHVDYPLDGNYRLTNTINASASALEDGGKGFIPIGQRSYFIGRLNGAGFTINDLSINRDGETYVGLVGILGKEGRVENITVSGTIAGYQSVGAVVGYADSAAVIENVTSYAVVSGYRNVGGILGRGTKNTALTHNKSHATVSGSYDVGGVVGAHEGSIVYCANLGKVAGSNSNTGGVVGSLVGTIDFSYGVGVITGNNYVGGLVGALDGTVSRSYSAGTVQGESTVGGLVGWSGGTKGVSYIGTIKNSYSIARTTNAYEYIGGLVGSFYGSVLASFSAGFVETGTELNNSGFSINDAKSSNSNSEGGLLAYIHDDGDVEHSFWSLELSNQVESHQSNSTDYRGLYLDEMKSQSTYLYWDFSEIWKINEENAFPGLRGLVNPPVAVPDTLEVGRELNLKQLLANDFDIDAEHATLSIHIDSIYGVGLTDSALSYTFSSGVANGVVDTVLYKLMKETSTGDTLWSYGTAYLTNVLNLFGPNIVNDSLTLNEDTAITVTIAELLSNDSDGENDFIYFDSVASTSGDGVVSISNDSITFTPTADWNGTTELSYVVNDGDYSDTGSVVFTVHPMNDAPVLTATTPQVMNEDTALNLTIAMVTATDIDGDALSIVVGSGLHYTVSGTVISPALNYFGPLSVSVHVTDGVDVSASALIAVSVHDVAEVVLSSSSEVTPGGGVSSIAQSSTALLSSTALQSSMVMLSSTIGESSSVTTVPIIGISSSAVVVPSSTVGVPVDPVLDLSSSGVLSSSSVIPLSSIVISPIYTSDSQEGVLFTQVVNTIDLNSVFIAAPESATTFEVYSIHGARMSSGYVTEGTVTIPASVYGSVIIVQYK